MGSQSNLPTARGNQPPSITVSGNNTTITLPAPSDYKVIGYRTEKIFIENKEKIGKKKNQESTNNGQFNLTKNL